MRGLCKQLIYYSLSKVKQKVRLAAEKFQVEGPSGEKADRHNASSLCGELLVANALAPAG